MSSGESHERCQANRGINAARLLRRFYAAESRLTTGTYPKTLGGAGKRKRTSSFSLLITMCQDGLISRLCGIHSIFIYYIRACARGGANLKFLVTCLYPAVQNVLGQGSNNPGFDGNAYGYKTQSILSVSSAVPWGC